MSINEASEEKKLKVLYIEDDSSNIRLMQVVFTEFLPYDFISTTNAGDGIAMAKKQNPSLILMDINMSGMDGYQALAVMEADRDFDGVPVIGISGDAMPEHIEKALAAGFADYITKPFNMMKLIETIKQHIN